MRLVINKGELTLPSDFSFEIEQNSAFFSEDGAASIGATIPATPTDQAKLGFPNRVARKNVFVNSFPASIQQGVFQKQGVLVIANATEDSITCSMALEDSEFYSQHKEKKLRDIFSQIVEQKASAVECSLWLNDIYKNPSLYPAFRIAPVAVNYNEEAGTYQVNNEPDPASSGVRDLKHSPRSVIEDKKSVSVPEGYGLAPFLTLSSFFELLFSQLGYTVGKNCFSSHAHLNSLILLHNTSDVACNGRVNFADLVPNKSVSEILEWMQQKFHAQISVNPETKTVDILLLEDILSGHSDGDITSKIIGKPSFTYEKSSRVVLTPDTSLEGAEAAAETLQALLDKYGGYTEYDEAHFSYAYLGTIAFRLATGDFYEIKTDGPVKIGSNYFKYDRGNSDGMEEFSPEDLMPPMVFVDGVLMPYIGERRHRNTSYKNSKQDTEQDIIIADYAGLSSKGSYMYATTQKYDDAGALRQGKVNLNAEDQYFIFWNLYGKMLLNNRIAVEGEFNLPIEGILRYDMYSLKQFNGQMMLPTYLKYEVGRRIKCISAKFLLVKDFSDGKQDEPILPPPPKLRWVFNNTELEAIDQKEPPYGCDYIRAWADEDPYKVEKPEFSLQEPQYIGQQSYHAHRVIDMWLEDHRVADQRTYIGKEYFDQWYDAVAL